LADYGATVIKVESTRRPDPFRSWPDSLTGDTSGDSPMFDSNNAGKLGADLDLTDQADRALLLKLAAETDVFIENFRVGVTAKLGVDSATVRSVNPDLVYLSLSSQGQTGPEAPYRSYGSTLDLLSGLASVTGYPGGEPTWSSVDVNYPDQFVSLFGAALVVYCLTRGRTGAVLDVAQREVVTWTIGDLIDIYLDSGAVLGPAGNDRPGRFPRDAFACQGDDRWVAIACLSDAHRQALGGLVGLKGIGSGEEEWRQSARAVERAISGWTESRGPSEAANELANAGVPAVPVTNAAERGRDHHFMNRRVFLPGPPRRKGFPFVLAGYAPPEPAMAPAIGEHSSALAAGDWPANAGHRLAQVPARMDSAP
jgi:crotonobetainyl-CoA:carnitine CoA-transferase CaiB-like acyl-CoA transferase